MVDLDLALATTIHVKIQNEFKKRKPDFKIIIIRKKWKNRKKRKIDLIMIKNQTQYLTRRLPRR